MPASKSSEVVVEEASNQEPPKQESELWPAEKRWQDMMEEITKYRGASWRTTMKEKALKEKEG